MAPLFKNTFRLAAFAAAFPNRNQQFAFAQPGAKAPAGGGTTTSSAGCPNVACTTLPCPASCLNDVGLTTAAGTDPTGTATSKTNLVVGENIYGPFEAGFSSQQDNILSGLGCATGKGYVDGGIDTNTAEVRFWLPTRISIRFR